MHATRIKSDSQKVKPYLPWVVATALFMEQLDSTIINTAVPAMAASLQAGLLMMPATVAAMGMKMIASPILRRFGYRKVLIVNTLMIGVAIIKATDSSMASTIASSLQQMSMSFGLACGSLVTAWYLGDLPQSDQAAVSSALHRAFLTLGGLTMISSLSFWTLRPHDGESVSKGMAPAAK